MTPSPSSSPESHHRPRNASLMRQRFRSGRRYIEDVHWAWVGEISQRTVDDLKAHVEELSSTRRGESFSSIDSVATRQKFRTAIKNIKHGIFCVECVGDLRLQLPTRFTNPLLQPSK
ncbi:unnamed protein product [Heligmosomoides polygyrus]|uniref:Uncharacterized protein n=1 Tax=Heligmosomoides polygyrus TaxID=6339 RepID=A0A3P7X2K0_HELPZ|nr:unnamed protein product [Heligmosomoides polygyrus]